MIEVSNIFGINKGALLCSCDVYIAPWDLEINDVKVFEKGTNRWITFPAKETLQGDGTKKYDEMIRFRKDANRTRFRNQIMGAIDKALAANPDMKLEDLVKLDDELPF